MFSATPNSIPIPTAIWMTSLMNALQLPSRLVAGLRSQVLVCRMNHILKITRQDICAFVEHEQDRGLKINSVISNLRDVYTFINFLVEREILPQTVKSRKIRLKMPDLLPRAIPEEHMAVLLSDISNTRNRALILLLLRTGMRIGELLNDFHHWCKFNNLPIFQPFHRTLHAVMSNPLFLRLAR